MLCFGRFLSGITGGITNNAMGKSLDDTIPVEVSGQFGTLLNFYVCSGYAFSYGLGALLPKDQEEMENDNMWRVIFLMPAFFAIT